MEELKQVTPIKTSDGKTLIYIYGEYIEIVEEEKEKTMQ